MIRLKPQNIISKTWKQTLLFITVGNYLSSRDEF